MRGCNSPKQLIYLIPRTKLFKTAGTNLPVNGFTWKPDRTVLTAPANPRMFGSGKVPDEMLSAYPVINKTLQFVDRNNSVWLSPWDKPVLMRLPENNLRDIQRSH